jgi:hypothetical protein
MQQEKSLGIFLEKIKLCELCFCNMRIEYQVLFQIQFIVLAVTFRFLYSTCYTLHFFFLINVFCCYSHIVCLNFNMQYRYTRNPGTRFM